MNKEDKLNLCIELAENDVDGLNLTELYEIAIDKRVDEYMENEELFNEALEFKKEMEDDEDIKEDEK